MRKLQRQIARIDAAEAPSDNADLASRRLVDAGEEFAARRACCRRRRNCGPYSGMGVVSRVLSDNAASAPSKVAGEKPGSISTGCPSPFGACNNSGDSIRLVLNSSTARASASIRNRLGGRSRCSPAGSSASTPPRPCPFLAEPPRPFHGHEHVLRSVRRSRDRK